jgi:hypothetical protein
VAVADRNFGLAFILAPLVATGASKGGWTAPRPEWMGGGVILSFPSLALSRSGSEGISHPRIALRLAGPLAFAALRQPVDYNRALNFYQQILLSLKNSARPSESKRVVCLNFHYHW